MDRLFIQFFWCIRAASAHCSRISRLLMSMYQPDHHSSTASFFYRYSFQIIEDSFMLSVIKERPQEARFEGMPGRGSREECQRATPNLVGPVVRPAPVRVGTVFVGSGSGKTLRPPLTPTPHSDVGLGLCALPKSLYRILSPFPSSLSLIVAM